MGGEERSSKESEEYRKLVGEIGRLEQIVESWDEQRQSVLTALRTSIEALHKEAFAQLIRIVKQHSEGASILGKAAQDEVVYGVLRHLGILKPSLAERLEDALNSVRPFLEEHDGGVELVSIDAKDTVSIRLLGACSGCPASALTLEEGVHKAIKEHCPEIIHIQQVKGNLANQADLINAKDITSPFAKKENWLRAFSLDEVENNSYVTKALGGKELLICHYNGQVNCFENFCAHMGMSLSGGKVESDIITCPYHGFRYSLTTGECLTAPEIQLLKFPVRVIGEEIQVRIT